MKTIIETAIDAAKKAGDFIQAAATDLTVFNIEQKSINDFVSEVDKGSEKIITDVIMHAFPNHQVFGEEYGHQGDESAQWQWIIDPLDGTTNFLRSIGHYAVSIGVLNNGVLEHGVVYDPVKNELFVASKGCGSSLNGKSIRVSRADSISGGLFSTGVPFSGQNLANIDAFTQTMTDILECQTSGLRRLGAAALDLAYVAAGRYDGFWEANLKQWDISAGVLLVEEAGGKVSDFSGADNYMQSGNVIAAPTAVHKEMLSICTKRYS